jgi:hypothetical protein
MSRHEYLADTDQLEIKTAQGATPGEGGELSEHKVSGSITRARHPMVGVGLISALPYYAVMLRLRHRLGILKGVGRGCVTLRPTMRAAAPLDCTSGVVADPLPKRKCLVFSWRNSDGPSTHSKTLGAVADYRSAKSRY